MRANIERLLDETAATKLEPYLDPAHRVPISPKRIARGGLRLVRVRRK